MLPMCRSTIESDTRPQSVTIESEISRSGVNVQMAGISTIKIAMELKQAVFALGLLLPTHYPQLETVAHQTHH